MLHVNHYGLYFTPAVHLDLRAVADQYYIQRAWEALEAKFSDPQTPTIDRALAGALLEKLTDQPLHTEQVASAFQQTVGLPLPDHMLEAVGSLQTRIHTLELVRGSPAISPENWGQSADDLTAQVDDLIRTSDSQDYIALLSLDALKLLAGLVLERERWFEEGKTAFIRAVEGQLRPQGFIQPAVEADRLSPLSAIERQILATRSLVLMAQAASASANLDLWNHKVRGVSVATAAMYPIYYFYTTTQWSWDEALAPETVQDAFKRNGGWLEMAQQRLQHKDMALVLDDLRPIWDAAGGGMTTLTHGWPSKPKRRGWFG